EEELPKDCIEVLGKTFTERINTMIHDIVENSINKPYIKMSPEVEESMKKLRKFMFTNVYIGSKAKEQEEKAQYIVKELYNYFINNPSDIPEDFYLIYEGKNEDLERIVCDYIAGMTDRYAINKYCEIYVPSSWSIY
ncbi:MAG TPA: deoxyguanosinetriphosphate triphosphohydrolase, partial [Defluviitaleaceae bacterium]|nr:deoxyguanosinetriphosphate triphosphohydrolase [Defluviitaleaceae bacterium]